MTKNQKILFISVLLFLIIIYANTLKVPFYFDDLSVIDEKLKVDSFSLKNFYNVSFKGIAKNRPISNLTLALNYNLSKDPLFFHTVNIAIHIFCFLFVFLFFKELLALPTVPQRYKRNSINIALIASTFWAVHPIQTQAVTYIVQRMTSLCALFSFMCLYFYLRARKSKSFYFYILSGFSFLFALGSKEISAILPIFIILMEWIFFRTDMKKLLLIILITIIVFLTISYLFVGGRLKGTIHSLLQNKYSNRDYLITERLMTQPRVFIHYISLTLFPFYDRYILDYGFNPSRSLISPISTLFSLIFVLMTIFIGFLYSKKNSILSFCIFSFWLGHSIEGSIFNLEIAFEHRMYLPSVFLILLTIVIFVDFAERIKIRKKHLTIFSGVLIIYLGINTYLRNDLWRDKIKFYNLNIKKAPHNYRPYHNLGTSYVAKGKYSEALESYFKALSLKNINLSYYGIAQTYYFMEDYEKSIPFFLKALELKIAYLDVYVNLSGSYLRLNQYEDSIKIAVEGLKKYPKDARMLVRVGSIYFYTVQQLGNQGKELLEKYEITESKAFKFLESSYFLGNKDKDLYTNLPPAYVKKSEKEASREKRIELINIAEKILLEGLERYPDDDDLRNNLVGIYIIKGKWKDALSIEGLTKEDLNKLSIFLLNAGQFNEALKVLKMAQGKFGLDQVIEFNQAICFHYLGNEEDAIKIFQKIFETTSNTATKAQADYFIKEWGKKHVPK